MNDLLGGILRGRGRRSSQAAVQSLLFYQLPQPVEAKRAGNCILKKLAEDSLLFLSRYYVANLS